MKLWISGILSGMLWLSQTIPALEEGLICSGHTVTYYPRCRFIGQYIKIYQTNIFFLHLFGISDMNTLKSSDLADQNQLWPRVTMNSCDLWGVLLSFTRPNRPETMHAKLQPQNWQRIPGLKDCARRLPHEHDGTFISFMGWMLGSERWFQDVSSMNLDCRHIPKLF